MAYQKRNFKKDQLLTADDLNAMDDQIASNEESAKKANDDIKNKLDKSAVVQEKGNSKTAVMSQAAATEEFDKLSEEIDDMGEIVGTPLLLLEQGSIDSTTGKNTSDNYDKHLLFVRTSKYIKTIMQMQITFPSTDNVVVFKYDGDKNYIGQNAYDTSSVIDTDGVEYIRLKMFHRNSSEITPEYASENLTVVYDDEKNINNRIEKLQNEDVTLAKQIKGVSDGVEMLAEIVGNAPLLWEQGSIDSTTGKNTSDNYDKHLLFVRTSKYIKTIMQMQITFPSTDNVVVFKYDGDKNYIGQNAYVTSSVIDTDGVEYIRLKMFHRNSSEITPEYASENLTVVYGNSNPLEGRIICTYGDSITKTGTWQNIMKNELGLATVYNRGWSDSAVTMENKTLYINSDGTFNSNPITTAEQPEGTTEVQCSFCHDDRIAYIPTDTEIVLVMGGTNDLIRNKPIGTIQTDGNYDESTFTGALISTVQKIQARLPNATIILMTPIAKLSSADSITPRVNTNNDTIVEFVHAVRNVADFLGCNLIEVHNCGITLFNSKLHDGTHPSTAGHELIAKTVISGMKRIFPI